MARACPLNAHWSAPIASLISRKTGRCRLDQKRQARLATRHMAARRLAEAGFDPRMLSAARSRGSVYTSPGVPGRQLSSGLPDGAGLPTECPLECADSVTD